MKDKVEKRREVIKILKRSGYERESTNHYINNRFSFDLSGEGIAIANNEGQQTFISLDKWAVIGFLCFHNNYLP